MAPLKEGPVSPEGPVLNEVPLPTVTQCHFILQTDYCQCHTASITNSQRRGRQLVSTAYPYVGPTIVWHTCEQTDTVIIIFCVTIKLKVSEFKLARKPVLFL